MIMSKQEFLATSGLETHTLEFWLEQEWIIPAETPEGSGFSERDIARAHLIRNLQNDFGVNDAGLDLILHLMDQLHGMRHALSQLRRDMGGPGPR